LEDPNTLSKTHRQLHFSKNNAQKKKTSLAILISSNQSIVLSCHLFEGDVGSIWQEEEEEEEEEEFNNYYTNTLRNCYMKNTEQQL
jgi:hypothetical protein